MISAILLAAGKSKRMGTPKQLLKFGKKTILEEIILNLINSKVDEIILVLGYKVEEIKKNTEIEHEKLVITINKNFEKGMSSSIKQGIRSIGTNTKAVLLILGDQPLITSEIINSTIDAYHEREFGIVAPRYGKIIGHPVIFDLDKYKDRLLELKGDKGAKEIIEANEEDIFKVEVLSDCILVDVDDSESYLEALEKLN